MEFFFYRVRKRDKGRRPLSAILRHYLYILEDSGKAELGSDELEGEDLEENGSEDFEQEEDSEAEEDEEVIGKGKQREVKFLLSNDIST